MGLVIVIGGVVAIINGTAGYLIKLIRDIETILPSHEQDIQADQPDQMRFLFLFEASFRKRSTTRSRPDNIESPHSTYIQSPKNRASMSQNKG